MRCSALFQALVLGLICEATCKPPEEAARTHTLVGYRRVPEERARDYNKNGVLYEGSMDKGQTGLGMYLTNERDTKPSKDAKDWYCRFWIGNKDLKRVAKAWIPAENDDGESLWWNPDAGDNEYDQMKKYEKVNSHIKDLESSWDPHLTLRLSIIESADMHYDHVQMAVPPFPLTTMDWRVECRAYADWIPNVPVNYDDWHNNIKGNREPKD